MRAAVEKETQTRKVSVTELDQKTKANFLDHRRSRIRYVTDEEELIPNVRKLAIDSETPKRTRSSRDDTPEPEEDYTIEHAGEKIVMSGTLDIVDAEEEMIEDSTTLLEVDVLSAAEVQKLRKKEAVHRERKRKQIEEEFASEVLPPKKKKNETKEKTVNAEDSADPAPAQSFLDKLETYEDGDSGAPVKLKKETKKQSVKKAATASKNAKSKEQKKEEIAIIASDPDTVCIIPVRDAHEAVHRYGVRVRGIATQYCNQYSPVVTGGKA